jgi:aminoglycoside phosphotransferase (APT) family kinase protein
MTQPKAAQGARSMQSAVLRAIRADLELVVAPSVGTEQARMALQLAGEMLAFLELADGPLAPLAQHTDAQLQPLLDRADALMLRSATDADMLAPQPATASELHDNDGFSATQAALAARLSTLLAQELPATIRAEVTQLARDAVNAENTMLLTEHAELSAALADHDDPVAAVECDITPARLREFVAARLAPLDPGEIELIERVPGGYSKDTWRLRFSRGLSGHKALILRRDLPFGPGENSVTEEHALLDFLADAGLEIPRPLWVEPDDSFLGKPFLLFPQLPGKAVFGDWHAGPEERHAVVLEIARLMARLHALDPFSSGVVDPALAARAPQEIVRDYIRHWRDKWVRRRSHPSLILETAFDWLIRNAPASLPHARFVHSDISFRNTLIENGRLSALLDWEFWHLGDPMEDLSYFRLVAEPYVAWDVFMDAYQQAGGAPYDPERAAFYEVWRSVRNGTTTTTAWWGFLNGAYPATKAAYQGMSLYRLFLRDVALQLGRVQP